MSTVQRKVFEQLKSFMVRITFNKKYIFAELAKEPQAGRNSGKAPIPLGGASGEQGEGSLHCPGSPEKSLIRQLGSVAEMQTSASKIPNPNAGSCLCNLPKKLMCSVCHWTSPYLWACLEQSCELLQQQLAPGQRGSGPSFNTPTPWFMDWYPKQNSRFTVSCHFQSWNQVRFGAFNEFDLEFENPFDAQIQREFESEKWVHMNQTQECISSKPCEVKTQLCSSFCWHLPLQHLSKTSDCPNARCPHLTIHKRPLKMFRGLVIHYMSIMRMHCLAPASHRPSRSCSLSLSLCISQCQSELKRYLSTEE